MPKSVIWTPSARLSRVNLTQSVSKQEKDKSLTERRVDTSAIQVSKAWEAAYAPGKSLPMNLMIMWMSGNSVQIFSMMIVMMLIMNPLKGITTIPAGALLLIN